MSKRSTSPTQRRRAPFVGVRPPRRIIIGEQKKKAMVDISPLLEKWRRIEKKRPE